MLSPSARARDIGDHPPRTECGFSAHADLPSNCFTRDRIRTARRDDEQGISRIALRNIGRGT